MNAITGTITVSTGKATVAATVVSRGVAFMQSVLLRFCRQRTRVALSDLSDDMLADIGISREEAHREATRSLWSEINTFNK